MVCKIIKDKLSFWNGIHGYNTEAMLTNEVAGYLSIAEPTRGYAARKVPSIREKIRLRLCEQIIVVACIQG
jgi:hypothetical protein